MEPNVTLDMLTFGTRDNLLASVRVYLSNGDYYESPEDED